jgi:hypothetical protein
MAQRHVRPVLAGHACCRSGELCSASALFGIAAIGCFALRHACRSTHRGDLGLAPAVLSGGDVSHAGAPFCGCQRHWLAFAALPARIAGIYRADLVGAGAGALGIVSAMFALPLEDCLRLIAALAFAAAALAMAGERWRRAAFGLVVLAVPATLAWPATWLEPMPRPTGA